MTDNDHNRKTTIRITTPRLVAIIAAAIIIASILPLLTDFSQNLSESTSGFPTEQGNDDLEISSLDSCSAIESTLSDLLLQSDMGADDVAKSLTSVYCSRADLQEELPMDDEENVMRLIAWGCSVSSNNIEKENDASNLLKPYREQYCETSLEVVSLQAESYLELATMLQQFVLDESDENSGKMENAVSQIQEAQEMSSESKAYQAYLKLDESLELINQVVGVDLPEDIVLVPEPAAVATEEPNKTGASPDVEEHDGQGELERQLQDETSGEKATSAKNTEESTECVPKESTGFEMDQSTGKPITRVQGMFVFASVDCNTVIIKGLVPVYLENEPVGIMIIDPEEGRFHVSYVEPTEDKTFSTSFTMEETSATEGEYLVKAVYMGRTVSTLFTFTNATR